MGFSCFPWFSHGFPWIPRNGMVPSPSQVPTAHVSRPATCGRPGWRLGFGALRGGDGSFLPLPLRGWEASKRALIWFKKWKMIGGYWWFSLYSEFNLRISSVESILFVRWFMWFIVFLPTIKSVELLGEKWTWCTLKHESQLSPLCLLFWIEGGSEAILRSLSSHQTPSCLKLVPQISIWWIFRFTSSYSSYSVGINLPWWCLISTCWISKKIAYILQIQIPTEIPSDPPRRRSAPTVFWASRTKAAQALRSWRWRVRW